MQPGPEGWKATALNCWTPLVADGWGVGGISEHQRDSKVEIRRHEGAQLKWEAVRPIEVGG